MGEQGQPWERQEGESAKAYEAFCTYRDLRPDDRSLAGVGQKLGKSRVLMERWSSQHDWVARAAAYDAHHAALAEEARARTTAEREKTWAQRREAEREDEWKLSRELRDRARQMLAFPLAETTSEDGKTIIKPVKFSLATAATLLDLAVKLARLAAEMDEDLIDVDWESLTNEQVERIASGESARHVLFGS